MQPERFHAYGSPCFLTVTLVAQLGADGAAGYDRKSRGKTDGLPHMSRRKPALHLMRGGCRFADKDMRQSIEAPMAQRTVNMLFAATAAAIAWSAAAAAQDLRRATEWDLRLGQPVAAQPPPEQFRA